MPPDPAPDAGSATLLPQPLRSKAMTRYPAAAKAAICGCQISTVPVFGWRRTIGTPEPPVSVNHSFTPGRSAKAPLGTLFKRVLPHNRFAGSLGGDRSRSANRLPQREIHTLD